MAKKRSTRQHRQKSVGTVIKHSDVDRQLKKVSRETISQKIEKERKRRQIYDPPVRKVVPDTVKYQQPLFDERKRAKDPTYHERMRMLGTTRLIVKHAATIRAYAAQLGIPSELILNRIKERRITDAQRLKRHAYEAKVCHDRKKRREVLFAGRKAGRGRGGPKTRTMDDKSKIKC